MDEKHRLYKVGLVKEDFCDQRYLRDRDEEVLAETAEEAIQEFIKMKKGWLRKNEHRYVEVLEENRATWPRSYWVRNFDTETHGYLQNIQ